MLEELIRRWWIVAARGLALAVVGLALLTARVETLWILVTGFGVVAVADGVFAAGAGLAVGWLPMFLEGTVGIAIGVFTLILPEAVRLWFVPLVVGWAVSTGLLALLSAQGLRRRAPAASLGVWLLALHGLASIVFGLLFAVRPAFGHLTAIIAAYALIAGLLLFAFAVTVRSRAKLIVNVA